MKEVPTRSISRFIAILQAINRLGPVSLLTISRASDIPYPTVSRVIQTLLENELIERVAQTKDYRASGKTMSLSSGFAEHDRLAMIARPPMAALTGKIGWPLALSTRVGPSMVVRESTHHLTSLTLSRCPMGFRVPVLESAAGHVFLAYASDDERECVLAGLEKIGGRSQMMELFKSGAAASRIRQDGFASYERGQRALDPGKTSSIAVPVVDRGRLAGVLTVMLFASAMPMADAQRRYLRDLQSTALEITSGSAASVAATTGAITTGAGKDVSRDATRLPVEPAGVDARSGPRSYKVGVGRAAASAALPIARRADRPNQPLQGAR